MASCAPRPVAVARSCARRLPGFSGLGWQGVTSFGARTAPLVTALLARGRVLVPQDPRPPLARHLRCCPAMLHADPMRCMRCMPIAPAALMPVVRCMRQGTRCRLPDASGMLHAVPRDMPASALGMHHARPACAILAAWQCGLLAALHDATRDTQDATPAQHARCGVQARHLRGCVGRRLLHRNAVQQIVLTEHRTHQR
jgi:hypothetical protein